MWRSSKIGWGNHNHNLCLAVAVPEMHQNCLGVVVSNPALRLLWQAVVVIIWCFSVGLVWQAVVVIIWCFSVGLVLRRGQRRLCADISETVILTWAGALSESFWAHFCQKSFWQTRPNEVGFARFQGQSPELSSRKQGTSRTQLRTLLQKACKPHFLWFAGTTSDSYRVFQ